MPVSSPSSLRIFGELLSLFCLRHKDDKSQGCDTIIIVTMIMINIIMIIIISFIIRISNMIDIILGKPVYTKMDEFLENFRTAFDPPLPFFSEKMLRFFL